MRVRYLVSGSVFGALGLFNQACATLRRPADDVAQPGCHRGTEQLVLGYARHAWADRRAGNKLNLPWTNTSPPEAVRDERLCERAALAVVDGALPPGVGARATVIRAGGLYFVLGPGDNTAGEYLVVEVLDASFRRVVGIAN